jgi:hypothetical protein
MPGRQSAGVFQARLYDSTGWWVVQEWALQKGALFGLSAYDEIFK